jgi:hypothetical protein
MALTRIGLARLRGNMLRHCPQLKGDFTFYYETRYAESIVYMNGPVMIVTARPRRYLYLVLIDTSVPMVVDPVGKIPLQETINRWESMPIKVYRRRLKAETKKDIGRAAVQMLTEHSAGILKPTS